MFLWLTSCNEQPTAWHAVCHQGIGGRYWAAHGNAVQDGLLGCIFAAKMGHLAAQQQPAALQQPSFGRCASQLHACPHLTPFSCCLQRVYQPNGEFRKTKTAFCVHNIAYQVHCSHVCMLLLS